MTSYFDHASCFPNIKIFRLKDVSATSSDGVIDVKSGESNEEDVVVRRLQCTFLARRRLINNV